MQAEDDPLDPIIGAILDGNQVAWPSADRDAALSPSDRALLEPLRILAAIAAQSQPVREPSAALSDGGRFELRGLIGRGASGEVYRAWDARLQREAALKILPMTRPFAASVLAEARRLARVRHPGVVTIHDVFDDGDTGRICMELLNGRTLDAVVRESGVFSADGAARIGVALCAALEAIHGVGLVHGDVKAHNVMLETTGRIVLMDLGAGVEAGGDGPREATPLYMAPELFHGSAPRPQCDIFSLGVLLYHLVTGAYPVTARSADELHAAIRDGMLSRAALLHVPPPMNKVIARAVDVDPDERYASAADMARALTASPPRKGRILLTAVLAAASLAAVGLMRWKWAGNPPDAGSAGVTSREIVLPREALAVGTFSDDASVLAMEDREGGILLVDVRSGASRPVVPSEANARAVGRVSFRPGRGTILYGWQRDDCGCYEIREVPAEGGSPRTLISGMKAARLALVSVAADGERVLINAPTDEESDAFLIVDLDGGAPRPLPGAAIGMQRAALSPDGRFVVLDAPAGPDDLAGDLFVIDVDSGERRPLLTGPADDMFPVWSADGSQVLFSSTRAGSPGLWRLPVDSIGRPGDPAIVHPHIGRFIPLSAAAGGRLLFWTTPVLDIETAPFDYRTGLVAGEPHALPVGVSGSSKASDWSPDGSALVYSSERRAQGAARSVIVVHDLASGVEREISVPVNGDLQPRWSPDGGSLLIRGPGSLNGVRAARIVDLADGSIRSVFPFPISSSHAWAPDGRAYYYLGQDGPYRLRLDVGRPERIAVGGEWRLQSMVVSPDGSHLAAAGVSGDSAAVITVPVMGGDAHIVASGGPKDHFEVAGWTPDGQRLLAVRPVPQQPPEVRELITLSLVDGSVTPAGLQRRGLTGVRLRRDGGAIAYRTGLNRRVLWLLENLPISSPIGERLPDPRVP
jgi:Tol biopolymer transport system component